MAETYFYSNGKKQPLFVAPGIAVVRFRPGQFPENAPPRVKRLLQDEGTDTTFVARYGLHVYTLPSNRPQAKIDSEIAAAVEELEEDPTVEFAARAYRQSPTAKPEHVIYVTRRFVAQFHPWVSADQIAELNQKHAVRVIEPLPYAANGFALEAPHGTGDAGAVALANTYYETGLCKFAHPDFIRRHEHREEAAEAQSRLDVEGWHLAQAQLHAAWKLTKGRGAKIAILDDGIDVDHPELVEKIVAQYDFEGDVPDARPKATTDSHGTSCAGVATARGLRASGSAPEASLIAIRTPALLGIDDEARMFKWAADQGADVISCSWGPPDGQGAFAMPDNVATAVEYCATQGRAGCGIPIFFAAGNGNEDVGNDGYASNPHVLAIAASTEASRRAPYSDYGKQIFLCAPSSGGRGEPRIFTIDRRGAAGYNAGDTADPDGLYTAGFGGTSSATPLVAGVAGLMLAINPMLTRDELCSILAATADKIGPDGQSAYVADWQGSRNTRSTEFGFGRVHAERAVIAARDHGSRGEPEPVTPAGTKVTAPDAVRRGEPPPTFQIELEPARFYVIELATTPDFSSKDASSYFAPWDELARNEPTYRPPAAAWAALAGADWIYFRIWTTRSQRAWEDTQTGPVHAITIQPASAEAAARVTYPSGATFEAATPDDGIDRGDSLLGGRIPLIRVAGAGQTKLATNFFLSELAPDGEHYARISPELVRTLQEIREQVGAAVIVNRAYQRPGTGTAAHAAGVAAEIRTREHADGLREVAIRLLTDKAVVDLDDGVIRIDVTSRLESRLAIDRVDREDIGPMIAGPEAMMSDAAEPPSFSIDVGANRYYAVEIASDWRLLDSTNKREREAAKPRSFHASWQHVRQLPSSGPKGTTVYRMPRDAWMQMRNANNLHYRVVTTSSPVPGRWSDPDASTADADAALTPRIRIRTAEARARAVRDSISDVSELSEWKPLISFRPPHDVQKRLQDRTLLTKDWSVHKIEDAAGQLSLDYYANKITAMPQLDGQRATPEALLRYIRMHINELIDTNLCSFAGYSSEETTLWSSADPTGTVVHIDMHDSVLGAAVNVDDGSVVCARATDRSWTFSTIWTPDDGEHPVSGNREFGVEVVGGNVYVYTRGADRPTGLIDRMAASKVFDAADKLWRSLMAGISKLCTDNGGACQLDRIHAERFEWDDVKEALWAPSTSWLD